MRHNTIYTAYGKIEFFGEYLPERERPNWHYYQRTDGAILHFRKEHMVCVIEEDVEAVEP